MYITYIRYNMEVQWLSLEEMDSATRVQFLDETGCLLHSTDTIQKTMNPTVLPQAAGN